MEATTILCFSLICPCSLLLNAFETLSISSIVGRQWKLQCPDRTEGWGSSFAEMTRSPV